MVLLGVTSTLLMISVEVSKPVTVGLLCVCVCGRSRAEMRCTMHLEA